MSKTSSKLRAGAGRAAIELPKGLFPTEGFVGVHDTLHARVLLLESGESAALVSLEMTSLPEDKVTDFRRIVSGSTGYLAPNVWIGVTHTLSAPHFVPAHMCESKADEQKNRLLAEAVETAVRSAAVKAKEGLQEARVGSGSGSCDVNVNRDVPTPQGWWLGRNEEGFSDKTLSVLRFETLTGDPVAVLLNYPVRPAVMERPPGSTEEAQVTADLAGAACRRVETEYDDKAVALFFMGAGGDQAPSLTGTGLQRPGGDGYAVAETIGSHLGTAAALLLDQIECRDVPAGVVAGRSSTEFEGQENPPTVMVRPARTYEFARGPRRTETVDVITLGDIALVAVRPELSCSTGVSIRERSPFAATLVLTMVNGATKYMPEASSYERITYEAMNSPFARGSAESLSEEVAALLARMRE